MEISAIALSGMTDAAARVERVARRLAEPVDTVDLSAEMVALLDAKNNFAANARVASTAGEMQQVLLDLLA